MTDLREREIARLRAENERLRRWVARLEAEKAMDFMAGVRPIETHTHTTL